MPVTAARGTPNADGDLIASLRERIEAVWRPLVARSSRVALLDFPDHANVGDSAIWLGELACLRSLGVGPPVFTCDRRTYSRRLLAAHIGDGTILLHGGGNFGDLYAYYQLFRERVITDFPNNPIVILAQTIHFGDGRALARARAVVNGHGGVTVLARDRRSLECVSQEFKAATALCPDGAFCLDHLSRSGPPVESCLMLARTDKEATLPRTLAQELHMTRVDWLEDDRSILLRACRALTSACVRYPNRLAGLRGLLSSARQGLARERVARGCRLLSRGETVITDRLHGHILCLVLGIPHYVVDNSYGKVGAFYRTWTASSKLARWCSSWSEAVALARAGTGGAWSR